jgi:hypothetical protein
MSIKTPKRLVIGVIASLVFAPFAAIAPANAVVPTLFEFVTAESINTDKDGATTVAGASNFVEIAAKTDDTGAAVRVEVTGGEFVDIAESGTTADATVSYNVAQTIATTSSANIYHASNDKVKLRISTPTAGTVTIKVYSVSAPTNGVTTSTLKDTLTVTVNSAATAGVLSVANSTSYLDADALGTAHDATSDATISKIKTATTYAGVVKLDLKDVNKVAMPDTTKVTAVVTGSGVVSLNTTQGSADYATAGRAVTATTSSGVIYAGIYADGTAGTGTVTFSVGTTVVSTKTVTFFGDVATLTASAVHAYIPDTADGTANTDTDAIVATIVAKDSNGNVVPAVAADYTASSTTEKTAQEVTNAATVLAAAGTVNGVTLKATDLVLVVDPTATKTGAKTLTVTHTATKIATTVSFNVSLVKANTITLTADKTSYLPGELVTVTLTAKDKNGAFVANGPGTALLTAALTSSQSITSTLFTADVVTKSGIATATFYAPLIEGTVVLSGTVGAAGTYVETALAATKLSLSVVVAKPVVPVVVPPVVYDKPTLSFVKDGGRIILSGTAVEGEGDIIIYTKRVGTTAWKERAKTLEVAAPGDFNGSIKAPKNNVVIRVKQEGTGLFSNQIIVLK